MPEETLVHDDTILMVRDGYHETITTLTIKYRDEDLNFDLNQDELKTLISTLQKRII